MWTPTHKGHLKIAQNWHCENQRPRVGHWDHLSSCGAAILSALRPLEQLKIWNFNIWIFNIFEPILLKRNALCPHCKINNQKPNKPDIAKLPLHGLPPPAILPWEALRMLSEKQLKQFHTVPKNSETSMCWFVQHRARMVWEYHSILPALCPAPGPQLVPSTTLTTPAVSDHVM